MAAELTFYPSPPMRYGTSQGALPAHDLGTASVAIGASATAGAQVPAGTSYVLVSTVEECRIRFGAADVAAAKTGALSRKLLADSEYAFVVEGRPHYSLIASA
jgi:hypothetical protein